MALRTRDESFAATTKASHIGNNLGTSAASYRTGPLPESTKIEFGLETKPH